MRTIFQASVERNTEFQKNLYSSNTFKPHSRSFRITLSNHLEEMRTLLHFAPHTWIARSLAYPKHTHFHTLPPPPCRSPPQGRRSPTTPWGRLPSDGPPPPSGDRTTTVHAYLQARKLRHKTKEFNIRCVQRAANVRRPTP